MGQKDVGRLGRRRVEADSQGLMKSGQTGRKWYVLLLFQEEEWGTKTPELLGTEGLRT